jgi:orotidine-5'-phosphate decarboxylase
LKWEDLVKFLEKLLAASQKNNSLLCVGLDPEPVRFPPQYLYEPAEQSVVRFCHDIIEATSEYVCAYKPNLAFFEVLGPHGMDVFQEVVEAIPDDIPVIVDAKRGDTSNSASNYACALFDVYRCDAVTVNPYMGYDSVAPFLAYHDKGIFLLSRTSNPSARDFQDLNVQGEDGQIRPLYQEVAQQVQTWNAADNCGLVVGATYPEALRAIRSICPTLPILIPGVGAQGGDLDAAVAASIDAQGQRAILSVSRAILYTGDGEDYAITAGKEAASIRNRINKCRSQVYDLHRH